MYCAHCKVKARGVLDKYHEEIEEEQEQSFVLGKHALLKVNWCCWLCLLNDLWCIVPLAPLLTVFIIHQTHYEKSDWSRAFNQFTIACELDMINVISAADIAFIMSSSTSAWLPSPLECSPQKQNGWTLRFCFWGWIMPINWGKRFQMYTLFRQRFYYCILKFLNDLG